LVGDIPAETICCIVAWAADQVDTQILADTGKVNLAFVLRDAKCYDEALELFEEAKSPRNNKLYVDAGIAWIYYLKEECDTARDFLESVLEALESGVDVYESEDAERYRQRGLRLLSQIYSQQERLDEAAKIHNRLLHKKLDPPNGCVWNHHVSS
jgi:tetratricopeptide (TPR) repeat protein